MSTFNPPVTLNVLDEHGGFTALTRAGTLWRPGAVLKRGTLGTLIPGSVNHSSFYQTNDDVTSADYKLPGYGYRVRAWWDNASGRRIA